MFPFQNFKFYFSFAIFSINRSIDWLAATFLANNTDWKILFYFLSSLESFAYEKLNNSFILLFRLQQKTKKENFNAHNSSTINRKKSKTKMTARSLQRLMVWTIFCFIIDFIIAFLGCICHNKYILNLNTIVFFSLFILFYSN